jgi:hypothetical protein
MTDPAQLLSVYGGLFLLLLVGGWSVYMTIQQRHANQETRSRPLRLVDDADGEGAKAVSLMMPAMAMAFSGAVGYGLYLLLKGSDVSLDAFSRFSPAEAFGALIVLTFLLVGPATLIYWFKVAHEYRAMRPGQLLISAAPVALGRPVTLTYTRTFERAEHLTSFSARIVAGRYIRRHERSVWNTLKEMALDSNAAQLKDGVLKAVWDVTLERPDDPALQLPSTDGANVVYDLLATAVNQYGTQVPLIWRLEVAMDVSGFPPDDSTFHLPVA